MSDGGTDFSSVEFNTVLGKSSFFLQGRRENKTDCESEHNTNDKRQYLQVEEKLSTIDVIKNHVQLVLCLEGVVQLHNKRMLDLLENAFFGFGVSHLLSSNDRFLTQHFHCVSLSSGLHFDLHDLQRKSTVTGKAKQPSQQNNQSKHDHALFQTRLASQQLSEEKTRTQAITYLAKTSFTNNRKQLKIIFCYFCVVVC